MTRIRRAFSTRPIPTLSESERQRFLSRIARTTADHWMWLGSPSTSGYAYIQIRGVHFLVHRVSYELHIGPIPVNWSIDHLCRTPLCVNPQHLEAVPIGVNVLRGNGMSARWKARDSCPQGHAFAAPDRHARRRCPTCERLRQREIARLVGSAARSLGITHADVVAKYGRSLRVLRELNSQGRP